MKSFIENRVRESLLTESRVKFPMNIPSDIVAIKDIFVKNGYKLFIVGGAVRDVLQDKPIKDYDLATDALPDVVEDLMNKAGLRTLGTGKSFGVINVFTDKDEYEIATFREDGDSSDSRRPDSVKFSNIETDVKRRDLTINALFYDISTGEIVDLVGGIDDIKNGVVRTVGKPKDRFDEDRLRILRAIRFAARYGSKLNDELDEVLKQDSDLGAVSAERIRDEFIKSVKSAQSIEFLLNLYNKYGLLDQIFKGLEVSRSFIDERDYIVLIAFLLRKNQTSSIRNGLAKLTYTGDEVKAVTFLNELKTLTAETAPLMKKQQKNVKITDKQIQRFSELTDLDMNIINAFMKYDLTVSGQEVMDNFGLKGADIGNKVLSLEIEEFKKLL